MADEHIQHKLPSCDCFSRVFVWPVFHASFLGIPLTEVSRRKSGWVGTYSVIQGRSLLWVIMKGKEAQTQVDLPSGGGAVQETSPMLLCVHVVRRLQTGHEHFKNVLRFSHY